MSTVVNVPAGGGSWFSQNANMIGSLAGGLISVIGSAVGGNKAGNNTQPVGMGTFTPTPVPPPQKDNTMLYVGVGVVAVAAIAFFASSKKTNRKRR
jgi:hypothetical protein